MNRRTFLASSGAAAGVALAGCGGLLGETVTLGPPAEQVEADDDGVEKALVYRHEGDRVAVVGLEQRRPQDSPTGRFPFRLSVPHSDETTIESFRFDIRLPYPATGAPAEVYLKAPGGGLWPRITFREVADGWTRVALEDTGELGDGTLTLETVVQPYAPAERLDVRGEVALSTSASLDRYRVEPDASLSLVTA